MKQSTKPSVGKLLRVLVAGGVALAGAGPLGAMADDAPAKTEKAATEKPADTKKPAAADAKKKAGAEKEKKAPEKMPEEAGGVKGW